MTRRGGGHQGHDAGTGARQDGREQTDGTGTGKRKKGRRDRRAEHPLVPTAPPAITRRRRVLYVGCEGESTEPDYLRYLQDRFGSGELTGQPFVIHTVSKKNGLKPEEVVEEVKAQAAEDEAWALFDRDQHTKIPQAVADAAAFGVEMCFSHPSFDLWLLLHFQAFGGAQSGSSEVVHDKLRKAHPAFKNFDKRNDKSVKGARAEALEDKADKAIANAKSLLAQCEYGACKAIQAKIVEPQRQYGDGAVALPSPKPPERWAARSGHAPGCQVLDRDPSTDVWRLLVSLGITEG
ncbi:RloB domain-containing protein [Streptomyces mirabilis]|uniref:RloB family protein n=1 Tax=Streptomyces mirabilis TaxID=68239 RepID=UPI001BAEB02B|nr:RloB family protein [Streptomyces mirabilis]QUW79442.1 RloB domain-containing protein [Streptomyces mirabilis]